MPSFIEEKRDIEAKLNKVRTLIDNYNIDTHFEDKNMGFHNRYETILQVFESQLNQFEIELDQFNEEIEDFISENLD